MKTIDLHNAIAAVCPIVGVSIGDPADKKTWKVAFADVATKQQIVAAQSVVDGFDMSATPTVTIDQKLQTIGLSLPDLKAALQ